jgi:hypothetical protein
MPNLDEGPAARPLVSNSSTLVFSVFLLAAAAVEFAADDLGFYVLACGLIGLLGYLVLEAARGRRLKRAAEADRRLNRHLTTPIAPLPLDFDGDPVREHFHSTSAESSSRPRGGAPSPRPDQAG